MTSLSHTGFDPGPLVQPLVQRTAAQVNRLSLARRAIGPVLVVALWAAATSNGLIDPSVLPSPAKLGTTFVQLWHDGLLRQIGASLTRAVVGGAFGIVIGLALGIAAGL